MKKIILTFGVFSSLGLFAQNNVGVGTLTPNPQSILEIKSDDKGVLISRLTTVSRNTLGTSLTAVEDGMLVYDKDMTTFFYWDGPNLQWVQVGSGTGDNWGADVVNIAGTNIAGDGTVGAPIIVTEVDGDITNEIQDLSLDPNTNILTITNNGTATNIDLTPYIDNTDAQDLSYDPNTNVLTLTNDGTTVDLSTIKDHDWYEVGGTTQPDAITDNIFTQGNVGIGTITPSVSLEIESNDFDLLVLNRTHANQDPAILFKGQGNQTWRLAAGDAAGSGNADFRIRNSADIEVLRFTEGRSVGIGTTAPTSRLHVATPDVYAARIQSTANAYTAPGLQSVLAFSDINDDVYAYFGDGSSADQLTMVSYFNYDINLSSFSSNTSASRTGTIFMEGTNGNVGIQNQVPTSVLDINGDLRVRTITPGASSDEVLVVDGTGVVKKVAALVPPGMVNAYAGTVAPSGYLICDGSAVSRTTYANLFAAIGTIYGIGNGTTTFNLPDLRGEFIRGLDAGRGADAGRVNGSFQTGTKVTNDNGAAPAVHTIANIAQNSVDPTDVNMLIYYNGAASSGTYGSAYVGMVRPRNVAMNYCIKF